MQLWLSLTALKLTLTKLLGFNQNYLYKAFNTSSTFSSENQLPANILPKNLKLTPTSFYDNESLSLVYYLSRVNKSLSLLNNQVVLPRSFNKDRNPALNKMYTLLPDLVSSTSDSNVRFQVKEISNNVSLYALSLNTPTYWNQAFTPSTQSLKALSNAKFYTLNTKLLQNLNNTEFGTVLNNLNIYSNLNQSKQDRWLLKNSMLSNSSTVDLNAFTQAKKLIGVNLLDASNTSYNIWNSSKMTQLTKAEELQKLSLLQNFTGLNNSQTVINELRSVNESASGLFGFNFFETSSLWTTKKFFFTNQLKLNTLVLNTTLTQNKSSSASNSAITFNFVSNLHNTNINLQLNDLNTLSNINHEQANANNLNALNLSVFVNSGDLDLLKSFNLNVINTLTTPIVDKNSSNNNYTTVIAFKKPNTVNLIK